MNLCFSAWRLWGRYSFFLFLCLFFLPVKICYSLDLNVDATTYYADSIKSDVTVTSSAGTSDITVSDASVFTVGQNVLIFNMNGSYIGQYETNVILSISTNTLTMANALANSYTADAQVIAFEEYDNVNITNSGVLTCSAWNNSTGGVIYIKAGSLTVDSTSQINASSKGFPKQSGPGAGGSTGSKYGGGGGGAYGGDGSNGNGTQGGASYGSIINPVHLGSGGGNTTYRSYTGGAGGGLILLDIDGTLSLSGAILCNGQAAPNGGSYDMCGGGGSGGTVNINAVTFDGTGNIQSNGGNRYNDDNGGGGGGGRIAVQCTTNNFTGTCSASGGVGYSIYGGAGTVYLSNNGETTLIIQNSTTNSRDKTLVKNNTPSDIDYYKIQSANVTLESGLIITGQLELSGSLNLYSYAYIDLAGFIVTGAGNTFYNYSAGYVNFASYDYVNLYFKNDGQITIDDKILTLSSGSTFVAPHPLTDTDYDLIINSGGTYINQTNQRLDFSNVIINDGGTLTHQNNNTTSEGQMYNLDIYTTGNFTINANGNLDVSSKGYAKANGPGAGGSTGSKYGGGGGGAYGGDGSNGNGTQGGAGYGSIINPVNLGSGGGNTTYRSFNGGAGGGAVFLNIDGVLTVNGAIKSNGQAAPNGGSYDMCGGGGSGGTVNINTLTLDGTGSIQSNGGNRYNDDNGGGGAGGRIAVQCTSNNFTGTYSASGGVGYSIYGGAGTIYLNNNGETTLTIQNSTTNSRDNTLVKNDTPSDIDYFKIQSANVNLQSGLIITGQFELNGNLTLYNYANITPTAFIITGTSNTIYNYSSGYMNFASYSYANTYFKNDGQITIDDKTLTLSSGSTFVAPHPLTDIDYDLIINSGGTYINQTNQRLDFSNVTINGGGTLTHQNNNTTSEGQMYNLDIYTTGNFTINANGNLDVSSKGYAKANGPGSGGSTGSKYGGGGGGAYGGDGSNGNGTQGGAGYGSIINPVHLGSGGGNTTYRSYSGGAGGGAILLNIDGVLTVNGAIKSNGQAAPNGGSYDMCGGGGSGGTININTLTLNGTGSIQSNGGNRYNDDNGGGGAGGRIAVQCTSNNFTGTYSASGGVGYSVYGGAGTVYLNNNGETTLIIKNNTTNSRDNTTIKSDTPSDIDYYKIQSANVVLESGLIVTGQFELNGSIILYNYANITPTAFIITGSSNTIYNYSSGYINFASYNYLNTYLKNDGQITIDDKTLTISSGSTFVVTHPFTESDYDLIVTSGATLVNQINQRLEFNNVVINEGGTLTHQNNNTTAEGQMYNLDIHTTGNFTINGNLDVSSKGYAKANGPGAGGSTGSRYGGGGGGAYGGDGSNGNGTQGGAGYGSIINPVNLGSGGGNSTYSNYSGGAGGGAVILNIDGVLTVNGAIKSNGQSAPNGGSYSMCGGGGSGGTVNITALTLDGAGIIQSNGGNRYNDDNGGGGAGGRIAVQCTTNNFTGTYSASGGVGYSVYGGAGTVYLNNNGETTLIIQNSVTNSRDNTTIKSDTPFDLDYYKIQSANVTLQTGLVISRQFELTGNVILYNNAYIDPSAFIITGSSNTIYNNASGYINFASYNYANTYFKNDGQITIQDKILTISSGSTFVITHPFTDSDYDLIVNSGGIVLNQMNQRLEFSNVVINDGGSVTHQNNNTTAEGQMYNLDIHTTGDFSITSSGVLSASSKGYAKANGPGAGGTTGSRYGGGGGGAYGGDGGNGNGTQGGAGYGSIINPVNLGSGGGNSTYSNYSGGAGGGAIFLNIDGVLTCDGVIRTNGQNAPNGGSYSMCGGGGSGGTVNINTLTLDGTGTIQSNGGTRYNDDNGGGGGGGRIAIQCTTNNFIGTYSASGSLGYSVYGGAGTIYLNNNGETTLIIQNSTTSSRDKTTVKSDTPSDLDYYFIQSANVTLQSGLEVTRQFELNGNVILYNNTNVTPTAFIITGSNNTIYNNASGYINFASYSYANTYFKNDGQINIEDKDLTISSGSTFVITHPFTDSDYDLIVNSGGIVLNQMNQRLEFSDVVINDGGSVTHQNNNTTAEGQMYNLDIHTTGDFSITSSGVLSASSKGYAKANGPGAGGSTGSRYGGGGGGAYGGDGGNGNGTQGGAGYGSIINPVHLGSGGGNSTYSNYSGGAGGGAIFLNIDGILTVDGVIRTNGQNAPNGGSYSMCGGGGAGGTVNINALTFDGSGSIQSNGGTRYNDDNGGGGAGGRIAVQCTTNNFTGTCSASGSIGYGVYGGAGTIYFNNNGETTVIIQNSTTSSRDNTTIKSDTPSTIDHYKIQSSNITLESGLDVTGQFEMNGNTILYNNTTLIPSAFIITGSSNTINNNASALIGFSSFGYQNLYFKNDGNITIQDKILEVAQGSNFVAPHALNNLDYDLIVRSGGTFLSQTTDTFNFNEVVIEGSMTHSANGTDAQGEMYKLNVHTIADFSLMPTGSINVSGRGYSSDNGPGKGGTSGNRYAGGGGGGYGGNGSNGYGTTGGVSYGDMTNPTSFGSGGGTVTYYNYSGASGGGALFLDVDGLLAVNGQIISKGNNSPNMGNYNDAGGPGSGGSVKIEAAAMAGFGSISVNGGDRYPNSRAGGGAGGRIAVFCPEYYYSGTLTAEGGAGYYQKGDNGTIYLDVDSSGSYEGPLYDLVIILPGETFDPLSSNGKSGTPTTQTAGISYDVTVIAVDALYNIKTDMDHSIRLLSSKNYAQILPQQQTFDSSGELTFTVTEYVAASSTVLNLDDIDDDRFDKSSASYTLNEAQASKLQIILPGETSLPGSTTGVSGTPYNQIGRIAFNVEVRIVDDYFNKVSGRTDAVTLISSNAQAVIPSFSLSDGTATVSMTEMELGTGRILTASVADAQIQDDSSAAFNVVAGPLKEFIVLLPGETFMEGVGKSGTPDDQTVGTPFDVTVIAVDDSYNTKTDLHHLIQPVSSQQYTQISPASDRFDGVSGCLVFTVTQYIVENNISIEIRDLSNNYFSTSTSVYNLLNSPATVLQIILPGEVAQPGSASGKSGQPEVEIVGTPFNVTVNLVDAYYNPVQGRTDTVTLESTSTLATIPALTLVDGTATVQVTENENGLSVTLTASVADAQIPDSVSDSYNVFYKIPDIFNITPFESRPGLTQHLIIDGENFTETSTVSITGTGIDINNVTYINDNQMSVSIYIQPTAPVGYRDITVTNPDFASVTADNMFRVWDPNPPVISNYSFPDEARTGDTITIIFDVNELLQANPIVKVDGHDAVFQDNDSGTFTYTYQVTGSERAGSVYVQIRARDFVGNLGYVRDYMLLDINLPVIGYKKIQPAVISPNENLINDETAISFNIYDEHVNFSALVVIKDNEGTVVKTLWDGELPKPYFRGGWDAKNSSGDYVSEGVYSVEVTVTDLVNNDIVNDTIGYVTVDYDADYQSYIVFDQDSYSQTLDYDTYTFPIVLTNNDSVEVKSLSILEVILTDSSVNAYFQEDASTITLNPGESTTVNLYVDTTIAANSRTDLILHVADSVSSDEDYANFKIYISPVPKPDIVVYLKDMVFDPVTPDIDQNCDLSIVVKNEGTLAASDIEVKFASFNIPVGNGAITIPSLDIGEEVTVSDMISFSSGGRKLVQIEVDPYNTIDELDEYNNQVNKILQVGAENVLSGGIRVLATAPARAEVGSVVEIFGRADYAIEINGEMNYDYPVKGGSVTLLIKTTSGDVVATHGNIYTYGGARSGEYELSFRIPSVFNDGDYALAKIMVTDHTFSGWTQVAIKVYDPSSQPATVFDVPHGTPNRGDPDIDGDGIPNYYDYDIDGDSIRNEDDPTPYGGGGYYAGSGGGYTARSNPTVVSGGGGYYPRSAGIKFTIPDGSIIYPGTGESAQGVYQGVSYEPENYPYDAYIHSCDIAFSNDNPGAFEEIFIGAIVWADGGGYKEVPVSFFEIYPAQSSITKIGTTQTIPRLYAERNVAVVTPWQNQGEGIYLIEVQLDNEGYSDPDSYTDGNNLNNEATRAIIVGEFNELLDVIIDLPVEDMTYISLKDTITVNFEVWSGLDSLAPDELDILTVMFDDSLAMTRDIIIVKDGTLVNGEYNPQTGVYTVSIPAPLPAGDAVNGLYPGNIMVAAQVNNESDVLNGSADVNVNLTLSGMPPQNMDLAVTPCDGTLSWTTVDNVSKYNVYRNSELLVSVDHPENYYVDESVMRAQTYEYFILSVDSDTQEEGIITSPLCEFTNNKMAPSVDAGADHTVSVNEPFTFAGNITDDGCDDPYIYEWDFADGDNDSGTLTPTHTYSEIGTYVVSLTVTDELGDVYTDNLTLDVTRSEIGIDAGSDQTVNEGDIVSFQAQLTDGSSGDTYEYVWNYGDGDNDTGTLVSTHVYADNGEYTVTITASDTESSALGADSLSVNVLNVDPVLTVDPDFQIEEGETVELLSTTYTDPGTADTHTASIQWGDGDTMQFAVTGGQVPANHRYVDYGNYTITVTVTDDDGGAGTDTIDVLVTRKPIEVAIAVEDDMSATVMFTGVAGKYYEIWYSDDKFVSFGDTFNWVISDVVQATESSELGNSYNDDGDPDHPGPDGIEGTADDGRLAPYEVDTRYYRVVESDSVAEGDPWASEDVLFYHSKILYEGRNLVAKIGAGQEQTLNEILDCRFLPGGLSMQNGTQVIYWLNAEEKHAYTFTWNDENSWSDGTVDVTNTELDVNNGLLVFIKHGNDIQIIPMVGKVEMADSVTIDLVPGTYNLVSWPYADEVELDNSGLIESGLEGGLTALRSDQLYFWDPELQGYKLPVFYFAPANEWRNYDHTPCTQKIHPGESILIKPKSTSSFSEWTVNRKYTKSTRTLE